MSACPVHHLGYFLITSLGAETAEKVRRSHFADLIADYATFKSGVNALFGKFKCKESLREQLRTHAQSGAKSIAAYAARTTDVCSKAYPHSRERHSFCSLWNTSSRVLPTSQRSIICCTTARVARFCGKMSCTWRKHAKRRDSCCTHTRHFLPMQVRRSTRLHSLNASARTMRPP